MTTIRSTCGSCRLGIINLEGGDDDLAQTGQSDTCCIPYRYCGGLMRIKDLTVNLKNVNFKSRSTARTSLYRGNDVFITTE